MRVHGAYEDGEGYFIVADYVKGITLKDWLTGQRPSARHAAELCIKIADGLHYAHQLGVIHRDLKPANIMIDTEGEPCVLDFGLARRQDSESVMTTENTVLGTPSYMSPEQAMGHSHDADRRSDVYSLGVILFELLTGERPFRGTTKMLLYQTIHDDAPDPRKLSESVPGDLATICLKCLEKEPKKRYPTASELQKELERFLRNQPSEEEGPTIRFDQDGAVRTLMIDEWNPLSSIMSKIDVSSSDSGVRLSVNPQVKLQTLLEIAGALGKTLDLDEFLPKILDSLFVIFVQADRGFIALGREDGALTVKAVKHRASDDETIRISRTIVNQVMSAKEAILSADAASDERFDMSQSIADFRIGSMMCAPLVDTEGNSLGVIQIDRV